MQWGKGGGQLRRATTPERGRFGDDDDDAAADDDADDDDEYGFDSNDGAVTVAGDDNDGSCDYDDDRERWIFRRNFGQLSGNIKNKRSYGFKLLLL